MDIVCKHRIFCYDYFVDLLLLSAWVWRAPRATATSTLCRLVASYHAALGRPWRRGQQCASERLFFANGFRVKDRLMAVMVCIKNEWRTRSGWLLFSLLPSNRYQLFYCWSLFWFMLSIVTLIIFYWLWYWMFFNISYIITLITILIMIKLSILSIMMNCLIRFVIITLTGLLNICWSYIDYASNVIKYVSSFHDSRIDYDHDYNWSFIVRFILSILLICF